MAGGTGKGLGQDATVQAMLAKLGLPTPQGGTGTGLAQDATFQKLLAAIGGGGGSGGIAFVYQPGGTAGANVYTSWAALYAALSIVSGPTVVQVDDSHVSPAVIPAGAGAYNLSGVSFVGVPNAATTSGGAALQFADGATISAPTTLEFYQIDVSYAGTAAPLIAAGAGQETNVNFLESATVTTANSAAPFIKTTAATSSAYVQLRTAVIGDNTHNVFVDAGLGGKFLVLAVIASDVKANALSGSGVTCDYDAESFPNLTQGAGVTLTALDGLVIDQANQTTLIAASPTLYVNSATGSDSNPAGNAAKPWATLAKVREWMGKLTMTPAVGTVTVNLSGTFNEDLVIDWQMQSEEEGTTAVDFFGVRTNQYLGTAGAGTTAYAPTATFGVLVDAGVPTGAWSTSGLLGLPFIMTSGAHNGEVGILIDQVPGQPTHAYYLPLANLSTTARGNHCPSAGDTYTVYSTTKINGKVQIGPMSRTYLQDLAFDNSADSGANVVEMLEGGTLITYGCTFKGNLLTQRGGYWQALVCLFNMVSASGQFTVGAAGMFDNWGCCIEGPGGMVLLQGAGSDNFGTSVFYGATNPGISLVASATYRFPFGDPATYWLAAINTQAPFISLAAQSVVGCEAGQMWGALTTGVANYATTIDQDSGFYYDGSSNAPVFSGPTYIADIGSTLYTTLPINILGHGCLTDLTVTAGFNGSGNTPSGTGAFASGEHCTASLTTSTALGFYAGAERFAGLVVAGISADGSAVPGHSQAGFDSLGGQTTSAANFELTTADGLPFTLGDNKSYVLQILVAGRQSGGSNRAAWFLTVLASRGVGAATVTVDAVAGNGIPGTFHVGTNAAAWQATAVADTGFGGVNIQVNGTAATTVNWCATVVSSMVLA